MPSHTNRDSVLTVGVGDIHGRFDRVQGWLEELERALGRGIDAVFAVGDVEAFASADDKKRKAAKRSLPAEWADYAAGKKQLWRPFSFIGGNNEDFEVLQSCPEGSELPGGARYLGRAGTTTEAGLRVSFLSGIYAPTQFDAPLVPPTNRETRKRAGYFRAPEVATLEQTGICDLLLFHEWPKGLVKRSRKAGRALRAHRMPWIGNPIAAQLVTALKPKWVMCGHSHVPYATTVEHPDGSKTLVSCLDQAARPELSVFWIEWVDREPVRAGWGIDGRQAWSSGSTWTEERTPEVVT